MPFNQLFVWVEGADDQRFVNAILQAEFEQQYKSVRVIAYAGMKKEKITKFIESIRAIPNATYIFLADIDNATCVSAKKEELTRAIKSLQIDQIAVTIREIESWYLAGLKTSGWKQLGIAEITSTDHLDKEAFDRLRSKGFESRIDWMVEMLRHYSLSEAVVRNSSLRYFVFKFISTKTV